MSTRIIPTENANINLVTNIPNLNQMPAYVNSACKDPREPDDFRCQNSSQGLAFFPLLSLSISLSPFCLSLSLSLWQSQLDCKGSYSRSCFTLAKNGQVWLPQTVQYIMQIYIRNHIPIPSLQTSAFSLFVWGGVITLIWFYVYNCLYILSHCTPLRVTSNCKNGGK